MAAKKNLCTKIATRGNDLSKPWFVYWYQDGRRIRKYGNINTHTTAEGRIKAAQELIRELEGHKPPAPVLQRIAAYLQQERGRWRKKTYQTYVSKLEIFTAWAGGRELGPELFREFFQYLAENRQASTRNWYLVFFRNMLRRVGEPLTWLEGVERRRASGTPAAYFQRHQIARLKRHLTENDPELWFFCQFVYYCFVRPGELRLLRVEDVLLDDWKLRIPAEVSKNRATQLVTIPAAFRADLVHLRQRGPAEYIFHKPLAPHRPYSVNQMSERHRKALWALGFSQAHKLYSWKHTGAIAAVQAGVTVKELQIQLRHSSLEMVDKYLRQLGAWDLAGLEERFPKI